MKSSKMKISIWIFFAASILTVKGVFDVKINSGNNDFSIEFKGVTLLTHTSNSPMLAIGRGSFDAVDNHGNFVLEDNVTDVVSFDLAVVGINEEEGWINLTSSLEAGNVLLLLPNTPTPNGKMELKIDFTQSSLPKGTNRWFLRLPASNDEFIWGGGEQFTYLNLREEANYPIWPREQGVGRNKSSELTQAVDAAEGAGGDYHTSYWPQPSFLSSRGYHFELIFPAYSELRLVKNGGPVEAGHEIYWHHSPVFDHTCETCKIVFSVEDSLMEVVQSINPGQPELPEWVYNGAILGVQGGTDRMLELLSMAKDAGVEVSGLWIQDWSGKIVTEFGTRVFWNWKWNSTWYPDLDQVIKDLMKEDIRVTAYITPHLNTDGDVFKNNQDQDYWLTDHSGVLTQDFGQFNVATIDILKEDPECNCINTARIWYKDLIKTNLLDLGFSGWMADFGEYTPMKAKTNFYGRWWGDDYGEILHGFIPQHWASLNREAVEEAGKLGDTLFWMRSGGIESKNHQLMSWAGDQTVDWTRSDGLPSSIVAALSLAVSGMGLSHSDIGGYTSIPQLGPLGPVRDKELLLRWAEYSVFTPMMRTHEGNKPEENAQVYDDIDTLTKFGRLTKVFTILKPYIMKTVAKNANEGIPVMRPLFLQYQSDPDTYGIDHQYMFGDDLLVAPVTEPGVVDWELYLPGPDDWIWLWDRLEDPDFTSGQQYISVRAPLGMPPVFYRATSPFKDLFHRIAIEFALHE